MKHYISLLAFIAFISIQATAQKSSHETATYEVYAWALANINFKDWNLIEIAQQAPKQPIFYEKETIDTVITPDLFGEIVRVFHYLPITPAAHAIAMKKYEER